MIEATNTTSVKTTSAKGAIAFRIIIAFALAAFFIPLYIAGILKVIQWVKH